MGAKAPQPAPKGEKPLPSPPPPSPCGDYYDEIVVGQAMPSLGYAIRVTMTRPRLVPMSSGWGDYYALLEHEGFRNLFVGTGRSADEAIGNLVRKLADTLGLAVVLPKAETSTGK